MPGPTPNEMTALSSTHLLGYRYEKVSQTLTLEFQSGHVYHYHGVPASIVEGLVNSDSAGSFFHRHIKGAFRHQQA